MSKKNYKKSRKYKKMRRRKIIFGIEITVLLILSGILFVYAWINRSMDKMNQDTLDSSQIQINSEGHRAGRRGCQRCGRLRAGRKHEQ